MVVNLARNRTECTPTTTLQTICRHVIPHRLSALNGASIETIDIHHREFRGIAAIESNEF